MRALQIRSLLTAAGITVVACAAAATVLAGSPNKEKFAVDVVGFPIGDCGTFEIWNDYSGEGFSIEHFNNDGELVAVTQYLSISQSIYYNSEEPDIFVMGGPGRLENARFDFTSDPPTVAVNGLVFKITLPGYGVIFHDAGRAILDLQTGEFLFQAGPKDFVDQDVALLCAALTR